MAWIEKLRDLKAERAGTTPPFGWAVTDGEYTGFAVGGTCYRPDGNEEPAPGGDPKILAWYKPRGRLEEWSKAADFVMKNRPDLQVLVAAAFAAPLIEMTGHAGFVMSAWSRDSAVGKSSALTIGTTVWADPKAMFHLEDTPNSVVYRIGQIKVTPAYWDEIQLKKDEEDTFVNTLFLLGQGKEKARLSSDSTLKDSGDWRTILVTTGNRPLMDYVVRRRADTDAGAVRLFEFLLEHPQLSLDAVAQQTIASAGHHAGSAGRVYAAWLAKNADAARSIVTTFMTKLGAQLNAVQQERFFIAGMSCLLAGAVIADSLGLCKFDNMAMRDFLIAAFRILREGRTANLPINAGHIDIERVLADFIADHAAERLITVAYLGPGPRREEQTVIWSPTRLAGRLAIHISQSQCKMRIDKIVWRKWCFTKGYAPSDMLDQIEKRWGARTLRTVLGSGTSFAAGNGEVIEIPLVNELAEYNYHYDRKRK